VWCWVWLPQVTTTPDACLCDCIDSWEFRRVDVLTARKVICTSNELVDHLGIFLFTTASRPALGPTQHTIQWVPGAFSLGVKRPGCEADHSLSSNAEVKNAWSYTSTPQYVFCTWCLVKHRDNFTFTLLVHPSRISEYILMFP
jgi:hypothetical protein